MRLKKNWSTLVLIGILGALLVGANVGWAKNAVDPAKRTVVKAGEDNLTPQEIKEGAGGGKTGETGELTNKTKEEAPGKSAVIFGKIHPDGKREVVKVFKGEPQLNVTAVFNEKTEDMEFITSKLPVNEKTDQYLLKADKISAPAGSAPDTIWHEARADNHRIGWYAQSYSTNYDGGAGAESDGASVRAWYW